MILRNARFSLALFKNAASAVLTRLRGRTGFDVRPPAVALA